MANGHGGKRPPRQPAPASPPGALSRRTDGGPQQVNAQMTGMAYGENSDFQDIQRSAPMSAARATQPTRSTRSSPQAMRPATPLMSKTQRPSEPVTAGADFGPGPTPTASAQSQRMASMANTVQRLYQRTGDPTLQAISDVLYRRGV